VILAARIRERWGLPGMSVDTVRGFRDKQLMKERVRAAGLRVPRSRGCSPPTTRIREAERSRLPPGGEAHRRGGEREHLPLRARAELDRTLPQMRGVHRGELRGVHRGRGVHLRHGVHRGKPALREHRGVPPEAHRDAQRGVDLARDHHRAEMYQPKLRPGVELGRNVLTALGMGDGFTHMEWFLTPKGEAVFGEIGCRPAARTSSTR
jgi:hypothetical protein